MPDLIAQGQSSGHRWRREIPSPTTGQSIIIGRSEGDWNVGWDEMISRQHVRLHAIEGERVQVQSLPAARNPVFHDGQQVTNFVIVPGEHFVIGNTTFRLTGRPITAQPGGQSGAPTDVTELAYDHRELRKRHFRNANQRIDMLTKLPDLISGSATDEELLVRVSGVLLQATPAASAVAIVATEESSTGGEISLLHYDNRLTQTHTGTTDPPPISSRLVKSVVAARESRLHLWTGSRPDAAAYTISEEIDWAFCVPLRSEACPGWALYVTGKRTPDHRATSDQSPHDAPENLEDDVKFAELVGTMLANLRQSRRLERRQSAMRSFFAPVVMDALAKRDVSEVLAPREAKLSVLFCDLRGFTQESEASADRLLELLGRVSDALGVMTKHILAAGGVIGDFHGDAAMGFWGWPLRQQNREVQAAIAALAIRREYIENADQSGFRCGIGIASGRAVAGRIGTTDQVKVTAFGPVVNLASRLEGVTKAFGAEIILDDATASRLGESATPRFRLRRLPTIRPAGLQEPVRISQLVSAVVGENVFPESPVAGPLASKTSVSDEHIVSYENALDAFERGLWNEAYELLHLLPPSDRPKDVLIAEILKHNRQPPAGWDGVITLPK